MSEVPAHWLNAPDVVGFTIDAPDSKDLDDAIWIEKLEDGFVLTAAITAVSEFIAPGTKHDELALDRVETSYGKTKNWPMLPRGLAEERASLLAGETRRVFTTTLKLDQTLQVVDTQISLGVLRSSAKLCHADVPKILADPKHELNTQMQLCVHVAQGLVDRRRAAGAFVFYDLNQGWVTTEEGHVKKLKDTRETIGYIVVQEFMILANSAVAELAARKEIPILFRNHTAKAHAPDRAEILERLAAGTNEPLRGLESMRKQVNLVMNRADYGAELKGHYGLNLAAYTHCTSPIRRYPDLLTQRQLIAHILNPEAPEYPHTREEVTQLGKIINSTILARLEERSQFEKDRASKKAEGAIAGEVNLATLAAKEFERVVKVMVRGGTFAPEIVTAFQQRIDNGEINPIDLYFGLLETDQGEDWEPLRLLILEYLTRNPELAPSLCSMAMNLQEWGEPKFEVTFSGPDHARFHTVEATVRRRREVSLSSGPVGAGAVKVAKQRALVRVLATAANLNPPTWDEKAPEISQSEPVVFEFTDNPISDLQEYAQKHKLELPIYQTTRVSGADHNPKFTTICAFNGRSVEGAPNSSKKAAKKVAAAKMVAALREETKA